MSETENLIECIKILLMTWGAIKISEVGLKNVIESIWEGSDGKD